MSSWYVHVLALSILAGLSPTPAQTVPDASTQSQIQVVAQLGHGSGTGSIAFSPDGALLMSSAGTGIKIWQASSGKLLRTLAGGIAGWSIAWSPDSATAAVGGDDNRIHLYDVATGIESATLAGFDDRVTAVAFGPDGQAIVGGSAKGTLRLFDRRTSTTLTTVAGHTGIVLAVAYSSDGGRVLSAGDDGRIKEWNAATGAAIRDVGAYQGPVRSASFAVGSGLLAIGAIDGHIRIWNAERGTFSNIPGHRGEVTGLAISTQRDRLLSYGADGQFKVWSIGGRVLGTFPAGDDGVANFVSFAPDGKSVAVTVGGGVSLRSAPDGAELRRLDTMVNKRTVYWRGLGLSTDGMRLVTGTVEEVATWDLASGRVAWHAAPSLVDAVAISPDGTRLLTSEERRFSLWDAESMRLIMRSNRTVSGEVYAMAFSPDSRRALSGGNDDHVVLLDVASANVVRTIRIEPDPSRNERRDRAVHGVAFLPDGRRAAAAVDDGTVRLLDVETGTELRVLRGHSGTVTSVAASADGVHIASAGLDGSVRVWDAEGGREVAKFAPGATHQVAVAFTGGGEFIAAGDEHGTVRIWDVRSVAEVMSVAAHTAPITALAASGNVLVSTGHDGTTVVWNRRNDRWDRRATLLGQYDDGTWAVVAPDGRYDSSSLGEIAWLHCSSGREVQPLSACKDRLYRRGLLQDALQLGPATTAAASAAAAGTPPAATVDRPRLMTQLANPDRVEALTLSRDGRLVLTGDGQLILIWDVASGRLVGRIPHVKEIGPGARGLYGLCLTNNDTRIVFATRASISISDLEGRLVGRFNTAAEAIACVPDQPAILRYMDGEVFRVDLNTKREFRLLDLRLTEVNQVLFSRTAKRALIVAKNALEVWDLEVGRKVASTSRSDVLGFEAEAISDTGAFVAYTSRAGGFVWNVATGERLRNLPDFKDCTGVTRAAALSSRSTLVAAGCDDRLHVGGVQTPRRVPPMTFEHQVELLAFTADERHLFTVEATSHVLSMWDVTTGVRVRRFGEMSEKSVTGELIVGDRVVVLGRDNSVIPRDAVAWNLDSGSAEPVRVTTPARAGVERQLTLLALLEGGRQMLVLDNWIASSLVKVESGSLRVVGRLPIPEGVPTFIDRFEVSKDGRTGMALHNYLSRSELIIWNLEAGTVVRRRPINGKAAIALSPDGATGFVVDESGLMIVLATENGEVRARFNDEYDRATFGVFSVATAFAPDGRTVAIATPATRNGGKRDGGNRIVKLWDVASGRVVKTLEGRDSFFDTLAFSSDGALLAAPSHDGTVQVWDVVSGQLRHIFEGHEGRVRSARFSADDRFLFSTGWDRTIRVWRVDNAGASDPPAATLVATSDGNWLVVTPDGRFDTNNLDANQPLHWVMPGEPTRPLPIEMFMKEYYEPRLLPRILAGERLPPIRDIASLNLALPRVAITGFVVDSGRASATVTVEVERGSADVASAGGTRTTTSGAFNLRLFREGQLVRVSPGEVVREDQIGVVRKAFSIRLPTTTDTVELSAYAFNVDGIKSSTVTYHGTMPVPAERRSARAYVISIGVNTYADPSWNLKYAVRDAAEMQEKLAASLEAARRPEASPSGPARARAAGIEKVVRVRLIADAAAPQKGDVRATKENIKAAIDLLAGREVPPEIRSRFEGADPIEPARPEDLVIITFSGHGYADGSGAFYLFPTDIDPATTEITPQAAARLISTDELSAWLLDVDAGEMAMIIDACHSSAAVESNGFKPGPMGSRGLGQLAYDKRMQLLAATQAAGFALESAETQQGLLSYALVHDGLEGRQADRRPEDGQITLREWLAFAVDRVPELYDAIRRGDPLPDTPGAPGGAAVRGLKVVAGTAVERQRPAFFDYARRPQEVIIGSIPR